MKPIIVANWKCNPTSVREAKRIFNSVKQGVKNVKGADVVVCPPFVYLASVSGLPLGAQDAFWEQSGAFTGEVSPAMLKGLGLKYVILGHSERRKYFKEGDGAIANKLKAAKEKKLKPILCIDKLSQIPSNAKGLIIAYEPLFAIGTGKACSPARAQKMRLAIQKKVGKRAPVIYGGSVSSANARSYTGEAGFQGLLVGGASFKPKEFIDIVKNVCYR